LRPSLIIPRLRANCPIFAGNVAGAADFAAAIGADHFPAPYAYIVNLGDTPGENETIGVVTQVVTDRFLVVVCADNSVDDRGQDGGEQLEDMREQLIAALIGWRPTEQHGPIAYTGSDGDPDMDRARIWHGYTFQADTIITGTTTIDA